MGRRTSVWSEDGWTPARLLMLTSDLALSEVAIACGLSDRAHFGRHTGRTPAAWRCERWEM